jgi:hypothetical protein
MERIRSENFPNLAVIPADSRSHANSKEDKPKEMKTKTHHN